MLEQREMSTSEVRIGQLGIRYILDGSATNSIGVFELTVPPGSNVPAPHSHSRNEECVYVLDGRLRYMVGSTSRDLGPGECMHTPKGTVHAFSNPFTSVARALIVQSPDIGEQYFREIASVVNASSPPENVALVAVMARYGLTPAAPSAASPWQKSGDVI